MISVIQLEVRHDGKVYRKEDQTLNNPSFVVDAEGQYNAALSDGERTVLVTMTKSSVDELAFQEIMSRVAQALLLLQQS